MIKFSKRDNKIKNVFFFSRRLAVTVYIRYFHFFGLAFDKTKYGSWNVIYRFSFLTVFKPKTTKNINNSTDCFPFFTLSNK